MDGVEKRIPLRNKRVYTENFILKKMQSAKNISEEKVCPVCGKHFKRRRFGKRLEDYSRFQNRIFCSKSCSAQRRKDDPNRVRWVFHRLAREHLKDTCAICGCSDNLQVHHLDRNIRNNSPENLQTLCQSCHMKLHWQQRRALKIDNVLQNGEQRALKP